MTKLPSRQEVIDYFSAQGAYPRGWRTLLKIPPDYRQELKDMPPIDYTNYESKGVFTRNAPPTLPTDAGGTDPGTIQGG